MARARTAFVLPLLDGTQTARLELPHERGLFRGARVSVDVFERRIALGSWKADQVDFFLPELIDGLGNGAAFVVEEVQGGWAQTAKFFAPDAAQAGFSVDLDEDLLAFGAPGTDVDGFFQNGAVYTGRVSDVPCPGQSLQAATELLSMADGGSQVLAVQAGPAFAGRTCLFLGSITGTAPGFDILGGAVHVPLQPDAYFGLTATILGGAPFVAGLGVLDAEGAATARFDLPAGVVSGPAFFGLALHHAVVIHDQASGGFVGATNAVRLRLIP